MNREPRRAHRDQHEPQRLRMQAKHRGNILFVTGTDTGVGKTVVTALLLHHLRQRGVDALALKPFSSGTRSDGLLLHSLQAERLSLEATNPYHFSTPVAPWVAARRKGPCNLRPAHVEQTVRRLAGTCDRLFVEGVGGLLVPLLEGYYVADLIRALKCQVLVVAANRLGTINHTMLTVRALESAGAGRTQVVLNQTQRRDASSGTNGEVLRELLDPIPVHDLPFLGHSVGRASHWWEAACKKMKKVLARVLR